jgi:hypothetical protein
MEAILRMLADLMKGQMPARETWLRIRLCSPLGATDRVGISEQECWCGKSPCEEIGWQLVDSLASFEGKLVMVSEYGSPYPALQICCTASNIEGAIGSHVTVSLAAAFKAALQTHA